jgi:hypothetical protein
MILETMTTLRDDQAVSLPAIANCPAQAGDRGAAATYTTPRDTIAPCNRLRGMAAPQPRGGHVQRYDQCGVARIAYDLPDPEPLTRRVGRIRRRRTARG